MADDASLDLLCSQQGWQFPMAPLVYGPVMESSLLAISISSRRFIKLLSKIKLNDIASSQERAHQNY